ncbi:MAG: hypothetical protein H7Z10_07890 [Gemmatimonadaceae bacterium]|nr:hypothetical protein [Acetobacteraceae bacterium]
MSEVMGLFPTPLMRVPGALDAASIAAVLDHAAGAARDTNAKSGLLSHTEMMAPTSKGPYFRLVKLLTPRLVEFGSVLLGQTLSWTIKEMWVNVLEQGGHQSVHAHANSFISGVVYCTPSHPSANTVFLKGLGGQEFVFSNHNKASSVNAFNSGKWIMPDVTPGDLVLFPSYVLHEVPRNAGGQRITLSFNAIPDRIDNWGYAVRFAK